MLITLEKILVYGCLGILIEFFFTAVGSLINKNWKATGYSYLWMLPIYGITALALEYVSSWMPHATFYARAFIYVPIIYLAEAWSGGAIYLITGHIPWEYKKSAWTPMGLINLKYAPFWLVLAMCFDPITHFLSKLLHALTLVA